jgi:alpha-beta hydrolase superfamily lysophospholipase
MALVNQQIKKIGYTQTNDFISNLSFGTYNKKFAPNKTNVDWLCSDTKQLDLYVHDTYTKNDISAGLFYELLGSMKRLTAKNTYDHWNKNMPILLISGSDDPVGDRQKGVLNVKKAMEKAGLTQVTCKFYSQGRHDIFHEYELGIVDELYEDIKNWLEI